MFENSRKTKDKNYIELPYTDTVCQNKTVPMLDTSRSVARALFVSSIRPWDAVFELSSFIKNHGIELPYEEYDEIAENVFVHISSYISPSAKITSPAIICGGARICHHCHISGSIIGSFANVGDSSSIFGSILFDKAIAEGQNFISSSILGFRALLGAGAMLPDTRLDGLNVTVDMPEGIYITGKSRLGSVVCDRARIGANSVLNPGCIVDEDAKIYPGSSVCGYVSPASSVK